MKIEWELQPYTELKENMVAWPVHRVPRCRAYVEGAGKDWNWVLEGVRWVSGGSVCFLPQRKWGMTEKLEIGEVTSGLRGEKRGINLWQLPLQVRAVS